jgi:hypothetical protein
VNKPEASSLGQLLDRGATRLDIRDYLDERTPETRVSEVLDLSARQVAKLYKSVAGGAELTVEDFVPEETTSGTTLIFEGLNTLPVFRRFQKRFSRLPTGQIVGYNHGTTAIATGPGYFVVKPGSPDGDVPGEVFFDYTDVPHETPDGWPDFRTNASGLSHLVYKNMKDYMRKAGTNVYVGEAYKLGESQNQFFVLCRP